MTSSETRDLYRGNKTLKKDFKKAYYKSLKKYSRNWYIRFVTSRDFEEHFNQLIIFIKSKDQTRIEGSYKDLIFTWENELKNNSLTYQFILEQIGRETLDKVDKITKQYKIDIQHFDPIPDYISRQVSKDAGENDFFSQKTLYGLLDIIINKNTHPENKFILYSGAQTGKTTELKHLAYQLQEGKKHIPFLYDLNYFTTKRFEDFHSIKIEYNNAVLILDAYDEIKDTDKGDFVNELKNFVERHPDITILISSRTNFEDKYNFSDFQPLYLEPLSNDDIHKYIEQYYKSIGNFFLGKAYDLNVFELLQTPFYLKEMLKYYSNHNDLPKTKSELYRILINESFRIDEKHKQEKGYVAGIKTKGYKLLKKIAFVMTVCEKKELTEEELFEKLLSEKEAQLACHFGIFKKDITNSTYYFEHIAFKEFMVADLLTSIFQEEVVKLIFYPQSNKLINSWYNIVLLFLEIIQDAPEKFQSIIDVLLENDNSIIVEASPKFLNKKDRVEIFKRIFNSYKDKGLYIDYFRFRKKLMNFANFHDSIWFLVEKLKPAQTTGNYYNALVLLEYANYNVLTEDEKKEVKNILIDFLNIKQGVKELRSYILLPFLNEEYENEKDIEEIGKVIRENKQAEILDQYFDLLLKLKDIDKYAEWIFEVQKHIHDYSEDGVSHSVQRYSVYQIYENFKSLENISKALINLAAEKDYLSRGKEKQISIKKKIFHKLSELYKIIEDERIIGDVLKAFEIEGMSKYILDKYEMETAFLYKDFFVNIAQIDHTLDNEYVILEESLSQNRTDIRQELLIPLLMTEEYFIRKMKSYDKTDIIGYSKMKYSLPLNADLGNKLSKYLDDYFEIPKPEYRDQEKENQADFDLILDYLRFKNEIEKHCDSNCKLIYQYRDRRNSEVESVSRCVNHFFFHYTKSKKINIDAAKTAVNDLEVYNQFALNYILQYMNYRNEEIPIVANETQKGYIFNIVNQSFDRFLNSDNLEVLLAAITFFDFELTEEQIIKFIPFSYRNIPNHLKYKYQLTNEEIDDFTFSSNTSLLDLLIRKSSKKFINSQISRIIESENQYIDTLYLHFSRYIVNNKIKDMYKYLSTVLFDKLEKDYNKRELLYSISRIEDSFYLIENRFEELSDESKVSYFSYLKEDKVPEFICNILWDIYIRAENDIKDECLSVLLKNGCVHALGEFIKLLKNKPYVSADKFPKLSYEGEDYLNDLIDILDIVLKKSNLTHDRLIDVVLYPIEETAVKSKENLERVKMSFENIIKKYNDFHFLNRKIMTMTDRLYESGKFNWTIQEALSTYKTLFSTGNLNDN